ncbi:MAG: hypothetical protein ACOYVK_00430 [Bacillota bacterium]
MLNELQKRLLEELIIRYNYTDAYHLIVNEDPDEKQAVTRLLKSCKHALNFSFDDAYHAIIDLGESNKDSKKIGDMKKDLMLLVEGNPDAIFSELVENIRLQLHAERYIDFIGRVYRLKEAILKYIFIKNHIDKNRFSFRSEIVSKKAILKILRKKYRIYNPNLSYGITTYIGKNLKKNTKYIEVLDILNSQKLDEIMELRHDSIIGHGFRGVGKNHVAAIFGNPYHIIDDFTDCLEMIDINIQKNKYDKLNKYMLDLLNHL